MPVATVKGFPLSSKPGRPSSADPTGERQATAVELVATFEDGREERATLRRASARRKARLYEAMPGCVSVEIVRLMNKEQWDYYRATTPGRHHNRHAGTGLKKRITLESVAPTQAEAVPPSPPTHTQAGHHDAGIAPTQAETDHSRPYAWEVLYRRGGKTATKPVVAVSERAAVSLIAGLAGVDAAVAIRPLTLAEYRSAPN